MITSANVAGVPVPLGSRMPRKRPGTIRPGLVAAGALPGRGARMRMRKGLVRVEALTPAGQQLDEGVGARMAGILGQAAAKGLGRAGAAVGKAAAQGTAKLAKKGWGAAKDAMSPEMRHKIAVLGGKAAALKRRGKHKLKVVKKALKKKGKQLMKTRFGKALRATGRGLKTLGRGVAASARTVHAAYQTAQAQETTAKVGKALKAARKGGDKELVRALSMMQQGMGRGDAKRVKAAAAALKLIATHRAGGGTGPSKHAAKALASRSPKKKAAAPTAGDVTAAKARLKAKAAGKQRAKAAEAELTKRGSAIDREAAAGRAKQRAKAAEAELSKRGSAIDREAAAGRAR